MCIYFIATSNIDFLIKDCSCILSNKDTSNLNWSSSEFPLSDHVYLEFYVCKCVCVWHAKQGENNAAKSKWISRIPASRQSHAPFLSRPSNSICLRINTKGKDAFKSWMLISQRPFIPLYFIFDQVDFFYCLETLVLFLCFNFFFPVGLHTLHSATIANFDIVKIFSVACSIMSISWS